MKVWLLTASCSMIDGITWSRRVGRARGTTPTVLLTGPCAPRQRRVGVPRKRAPGAGTAAPASAPQVARPAAAPASAPRVAAFAGRGSPRARRSGPARPSLPASSARRQRAVQHRIAPRRRPTRRTERVPHSTGGGPHSGGGTITSSHGVGPRERPPRHASAATPPRWPSSGSSPQTRTPARRGR